jgi:hypothetical protein
MQIRGTIGDSKWLWINMATMTYDMGEFFNSSLNPVREMNQVQR